MFQCKRKGSCNASITMRELKLADGTSKLVMVRWLNPKNSSQDLGQYHGHAEDESKEEAWQIKKNERNDQREA